MIKVNVTTIVKYGYSNNPQYISEKGYISEKDIPKIMEDEDFKKKRKERKKKTSEERRGHYDPNKCQARVWMEGYDNIQCSFQNKKVDVCVKNIEGCVDKEGCGGWV